MNRTPERRMPASRRLGAAVTALALTAGLASCAGGGQSGDGVTLRVMWWGNPPRHQATNDAIALYEKKHPDVNIEPIYTGWDGYWDKLATQMAGGNAPDVMQMDYAYLAEYAGRDALLDLQPHTGKALDVSGITDKVLSAGKIGGGLYAITWATNTQTFTADATDIENAGLERPEPGWTWQDFRQFSETLANERGQGKYAVSDMSIIPNVFEVWLGGSGKTLYTDRGQLGFTKNDLRDYWTYWKDLSDAGISTPADVMTPFGGSFDELGLVRDVAEMDFLWDNQFTGVAEFMEHDIAMLPLPAGDQMGQYLKPSMFLSASAKTEHPEEAARFIDFMVTNKEAGKTLGTNRGIPADQSVRDMLAGEATGLEKKVFAYEEKMADTLAPTPPAPPKGNGEIEDLFSRTGENVAFGRMSVDEAVNTFFSRAQQILAG